MTKDELLTQIAPPRVDVPGWSHENWPLIVEFVAAWLKAIEDDRCVTDGAGDRVDLCALWEKEMGSD